MCPTERNDLTSMVGRVSAILSSFTADEPELTLSEIARRAGLPKSSASRIVQELVDHDFLARSDTAIYLGLKVFELGELATRPHDLRRLTLASMSDLRHATGQTIHLAVLEGSEVVYIEILPSKTAPRLPSRVGGRMPAFATAVGKALLASSDASVTERVVAGGLWTVGPGTITDPEELRRALAHVRRTGVAYEIEESGAGISCVAAAILGTDDIPIAALSVSGWTADLHLEELAPAVQSMALSLGRAVRAQPWLVRRL